MRPEPFRMVDEGFTGAAQLGVRENLKPWTVIVRALPTHSRRGLARRGRQVESERASLREDERALDQVLHLAHVAGPIVAVQLGEMPLRELRERHLEPLGGQPKEMCGQ